ncbi:MAG: hypothetical protein LUE93_02830 [Bacteroides sp.]|nr:hypothetical protein [Bacteroides sp.]
MNNKAVFRIAIGLAVIFFTGVGFYFYLGLTSAEKKQDINLYEWVPSTSMAVLETSNLDGMINDFTELPPFRDYPLQRISRLLAYIRQHFDKLLAFTPHGLSNQMNKILISFHAPDYAENQVLYIPLGLGDTDIMAKFVQRMSANGFPPKEVVYRDETIRIYPLRDNSFMACYFSSDFVAVSFRKKLIEEVIDARLDHTLLFSDKNFTAARTEARNHSQSLFYVRMDSIALGWKKEKEVLQKDLGEWAEYIFRMRDHKIYLSGMLFDPDSLNTFGNMIKKQESIQHYPDYRFPVSTYYFSRQSATNLAATLDFMEYPGKQEITDATLLMEEVLTDYLQNYTSRKLSTLLFAREDSLKGEGWVLTVPVENPLPARARLREEIYNRALRQAGRALPLRKVFPVGQSELVFYPVPFNRVIPALSAVIPAAEFYWLTLYDGELVIGSDPDHLKEYIHALYVGDTLEHVAVQEDYNQDISASYTYLMLTDLEDSMAEDAFYQVLTVPSFFFRHREFFRHFILSSQFYYHEGDVYSNLVLTYKE